MARTRGGKARHAPRTETSEDSDTDTYGVPQTVPCPPSSSSGPSTQSAAAVVPQQEIREDTPTCTIVYLNVGGARFMTTLGTLRKYPDSLLGAMFSGRHNMLQYDDRGYFFIDRDPVLFGVILQFLRYGACARIERQVCALCACVHVCPVREYHARFCVLQQRDGHLPVWSLSRVLLPRLLIISAAHACTHGCLPFFSLSSPHTGQLHPPTAKPTPATPGIGHSPFSLAQLDAELDYFLIPRAERIESPRLRIHRARDNILPSITGAYDSLIELATYIVGSGVQAVLSRGVCEGYLSIVHGESGEVEDEDGEEEEEEDEEEEEEEEGGSEKKTKSVFYPGLTSQPSCCSRARVCKSQPMTREQMNTLCCVLGLDMEEEPAELPVLANIVESIMAPLQNTCPTHYNKDDKKCGPILELTVWACEACREDVEKCGAFLRIKVDSRAARAMWDEHLG